MSAGAVIGELAPGVKPTQGTFPRRNRIISGLAEATIVVEAPARSGALITARHALEQGRSVLVAPGRPLDASIAGNLGLLRDSPARPLVGLDEMIVDLGLDRGGQGRPNDTEPQELSGSGALALLVCALPATAQDPSEIQGRLQEAFDQLVEGNKQLETNHEQAMASYETAIKLYADLISDVEQSPLPVEAKEQVTQLAYYNTACARSLQDKKSEALDHRTKGLVPTAMHQKVITHAQQHVDIGFQWKPRQEVGEAGLHIVRVQREELLELVDDQ